MHILLEKGLSFSLVYIFPWKVHFLVSQNAQRKWYKHQNLSSKNKTKQTKNWRQTTKTITNEFECFDVRPLHCNFCFFLQQKSSKSCTELFLLISCLKIFIYKFSNALLFWYKYVHRSFCFRLMQHSYAACDAALAATKTNNRQNKT